MQRLKTPIFDNLPIMPINDHHQVFQAVVDEELSPTRLDNYYHDSDTLLSDPFQQPLPHNRPPTGTLQLKL
jgi:hypothetical protein